MKRYILPLFLLALCTFPASAQDIILLNQDGEKVGVAKDVEEKPAVKGEVFEFKADKDGAKIENGVVTFVGPDGEVRTFKMSDAKSVTITRSSKTVVDDDGKQKMETRGKAILIGPDGVRREIDLGNGGFGGGSVSESKLPKTWMIGASLQPASPVLRSQLQLDEDMGLVVTRVLQGGAAEKAKLKANDILLFADQKPIADRKRLSEIVNEAGAAKSDVVFTLLRGGEEISVSVTPTEREGVNQMMVELAPGFDGFGMKLPGFGAGIDLELKQFGPGIIIGDGEGGFFRERGDLQRDTMLEIEEKIRQMREEMEEMQNRMLDDK